MIAFLIQVDESYSRGYAAMVLANTEDEAWNKFSFKCDTEERDKYTITQHEFNEDCVVVADSYYNPTIEIA